LNRRRNRQKKGQKIVKEKEGGEEKEKEKEVEKLF
jgi:hypothetical protein